MNAAFTVALAALSFALFAGACSQRVVSVHGILNDLPGAEGGLKPDAAGSSSSAVRSDWDAILAPYRQDSMFGPNNADPDDDDDEDDTAARPKEIAPLRMQRPDGSIYLVANSPGHVIYHLTQTLAKKEHELLFNDVLSDALKSEYRKRARDPKEAVQWLAQRERDIAALFAELPLAENTPGVEMKPIGRNRFRLEVSRELVPELKLSKFDVIIERGQFRLLMLQ